MKADSKSTARAGAETVKPFHHVQFDMDRLKREIDRLQRRISEPGRFVYTNDLSLLHMAHTMLCECESTLREVGAVQR